MSSVAVGRIRVDGQAPSAPLHRLLSTPGVLLSGGRWEGGVDLWGFTTDVPSTWDACSSGTFREKDEGERVGFESFDSFVIYVAQVCSTFGTSADLQGFARRADAVLEATSSFAVERALAQGIDGLANKYLGDSDLTSLATNVSPAVGLSYLENAIGATGRQGMIHLTPAVAAQLDSNLSDNGSGALVTLAGNPVVIGGGYIGTDPDDEGSPDPTHDWIFATGPVQARVSEILAGPDEVSGMVDPETNEVIYRAEKLANVAWDGALQVGVLVDWVP
jgi:hypothetical protein